MMDYDKLKTELEFGNYADLLKAGNDSGLAELLNAATETAHKSRNVTARTFFAELGLTMAATILAKLEAAEASNPALKWVNRWLQTESGFDIGHPESIATINALRGPLLTDAEADGLLSLSAVRVSRAEQLFGRNVTATDVAIAQGRKG